MTALAKASIPLAEDPSSAEILLADGPVLLFDGVCNFCSASVRFIAKRDPRGRIRFAPIQSEVGHLLLEHFDLPTDDYDTMVLVTPEHHFIRSAAGLQIARRLRFPWPLAYASIIVPRPLRDLIYRWIAKNRYTWFGRTEACMVPTPELRRRFVT